MRLAPSHPRRGVSGLGNHQGASEPMSHRMPFARRSLTTALLLAVAGAGCGSVDTDDDTNPDVDPDDTTAPAIASTEPATGATGVRENEKIHVTFSEPMDQASVEAAYSSADLPADQVT